jgi:hypothetical protein
MRSVIAALLLVLMATSASAQDTTGVGAINFASYSWNRRTNTQRFGEQQGLFPILGFDWRF